MYCTCVKGLVVLMNDMMMFLYIVGILLSVQPLKYVVLD